MIYEICQRPSVLLYISIIVRIFGLILKLPILIKITPQHFTLFSLYTPALGNTHAHVISITCSGWRQGGALYGCHWREAKDQSHNTVQLLSAPGVLDNEDKMMEVPTGSIPSSPIGLGHESYIVLNR